MNNLSIANLIPLVIFTLIIFISTYIIIISKNKKSARTIMNYDLSKFHKIFITFSRSSQTTTGINTKAILYINKEMLIIVSQKSFCINTFMSFLPYILFRNKKENITADSPSHHKITILGPSRISIRFNQKRIVNIKPIISIKLENDDDLKYLKEVEVEEWS